MLMFYHAPWSRSSAILWLLEELGTDYSIELVDVRGVGGAPDSYRAIQPNKKVPAIEHNGCVITERAAIIAYLADTFPEAGLAPAITDPTRGPYLTALVHHDAVFDPVLCANAKGWKYESNDFPFGLFDDLLNYLEKRFASTPFAAGEQFTAADVLLATSIHFTMVVTKVLPSTPTLADYLARCADRPAFARAQAKDAEMAANIPALANADA